MRRKTRRPMSEINVVPYIDVMLVLLVIFMVTAPLLSQGVKIDLPKAPAQPVERSDAEPLVVSVDARGRYYVNFGGEEDVPVDAETLLLRTTAVIRLRRETQGAETQVLVKGDSAVGYGKVVEVMALLKLAGAASVGLLTEPPAAAGPAVGATSGRERN